MSNEPDRNVIRPSMLYTFLAMVFGSLFIVLVASNKPDDSWIRIVAVVYLIIMQLYFVVLQFVTRRAEMRSETNPSKPHLLTQPAENREPGRNA
jgi:phosphotransferase system  glucose/maltose/N-acetylglucosamine-specific IIC component